jgi:RES domain-containing protein
MRSFRLTSRKHAATAFDGEGARLYGGRWNSEGTPMVYTAETLALATCEWRVHLDAWPPPPMVMIPVEFDPALVWEPKNLPLTWNTVPPSLESAHFGDAWVADKRSVILRVPSAVVPGESNYLINPRHPDFAQLRIGTPSEYLPDPRFGPRLPR